MFCSHRDHVVSLSEVNWCHIAILSHQACCHVFVVHLEVSISHKGLSFFKFIITRKLPSFFVRGKIGEINSPDSAWFSPQPQLSTNCQFHCSFVVWCFPEVWALPKGVFVQAGCRIQCGSHLRILKYSDPMLNCSKVSKISLSGRRKLPEVHWDWPFVDKH